ncbi:MAG: C-GCAxxG-C-C family protein [Candidatus Cloacimonetes bacterium]|nr:C-GCAxxG-C-C family protein [Candidatus Cloacimonadota bacterium]
MQKDEKQINAAKDHDDGFNCAQSVLKQFCLSHNMDIDTALLIASGFGGGMRMGSVCGALTGGIMALGLAYGFTDPQNKAQIDASCLELTLRFKEAMGKVDCRDIIGIDTCDPIQRSDAQKKGVFAEKCPIAIRTAVGIVEEMIARKEDTQSN